MILAICCIICLVLGFVLGGVTLSSIWKNEIRSGLVVLKGDTYGVYKYK